MYVDEYDDGACKLFMIEATASYHLRLIFYSSLFVFVCMFPVMLISFKINIFLDKQPAVSQ